MSDLNQYGIVTPEAVLLDLPAAGIATRMAAKVVDLLCLSALFSVGTFVGTLLSAVLGQTTLQVFLIIWIFVVLIVAPIVCEGVWNGRTPGKAIFGLRAVTLDGGPVMWRHCVLRGLAQIFDVYSFLGVIPALATRRSQRFGDLMAGTFVLVEPPAHSSATPIAFYPPPGWERFVGSLDVGRIRPEQYRLVRSFLLRVNELDSSARWHMAVRMAEAVRSRVSPPPVSGMSAEVYLVCVASAYQYRNGGLPAPSQATWSAVPHR
jgi:uncharacterized RDD family membrane protein YckC